MKKALIFGFLFLLASKNTFALPGSFQKTLHLGRGPEGLGANYMPFTTANDYVYDSNSDGQGNIYIAGSTDGSLPGGVNAGGLDAYVAKFSSAGVLQWVKQFGTAGDDVAYGVTPETTNPALVYVTGYTTGSFPTYTNAGSNDVFIGKFSATGVQTYMVQFGTAGSDIGYAVTRDSTKNPIIVGSTTGAFPTKTNAGGKDMFLTERALATGAQSFMTQQGTTGDDEFFDVGIDSSNRPYATGYTSGSFPTFTNAGGDDVYVARFLATGNLSWEKQFGTSGDDYGQTIPMTTAGVSWPGGTTSGTMSGGTSAGGEDAWFASYTAAGVQSKLTQFGTSENDGISGGRIDGSSQPNFVGTTLGSFTGYTNLGSADIFFTRYSTAGARQVLVQTGTNKVDSVKASGVLSITTFPVGGHSDQSYSGYSVLKGYDTYLLSFSTTGVLSILQQLGSSN